MNSRTLKIGGAVALVLAVAAIWTSSGNGNTRAADEATRVYPELLSAITANRVAALTVETATEDFTVERSGDAWGMVERGGYPVSFEKVKEIVNQIAFFEIIEPKTSNPELYDRLQVEDIDSDEAKSSKVTVKDEGGAVLASLIVGKSNPSRGAGMGKPTLYVRKAGEAASYEVAGKLYVNTTPTNWLDKEICKLDRERVHRVTTEQPDGEKLEVVKDDPSDPNFTVVDLPADAELKWAGVADGMGGALETLRFDDVQKDDGSLDFEGEDVIVTHYQTFDGLQLTLRLLKRDEKSYVKLSAAFDEAARVAVAPKVEEAPADVTGPDDASEGEEEIVEEPPAVAEPEVPGSSSEDVAKEASELEQKLQPWVYVVPGYTAANFSKTLKDMLKEEEPSAPDSGIGPPLPGMELLPDEASDGFGGGSDDEAGDGAGDAPAPEDDGK